VFADNLKMKTIFCLAILGASFLGVSRAVAAQPVPESPIVINLTNLPAPKIKFEKMIWDFGKVTGGDTVKAEFIFTNIGERTLEVMDVHPGCGCTTAGDSTRKVEPGKTGVIPLQLNTTSLVGDVIKTAAVSCNDPETPQLTLQLKASVWRPIEVSPQIAIMPLTTESPSNAASVKIINNIDTPLEVSDVASSSPAFGAELKTLKAGKEYEIWVRTLPPFPSNTVQASVTAKTSSSNMPTVSVVAYASVQPTIMAIPAQITLPQAPLTNLVTATVTIRSTSTNAVQVTDPVVNVKGTEVRISGNPQSKFFNIVMMFPAGTIANAAENPELTVKTSHPMYPVIKVPIIQPQPIAAGAPAK
jgi:hypothetical protein